MKLVRFIVDGAVRTGALRGQGVVDLSDLAPSGDVLSLLKARDRVETALAADTATAYPLTEVQLAAPVKPPKYFGIGLNYADHVEEAGLDRPDVPTVFNKQPTCVIGSGQEIVRPRASEALDYEGEMAFVIGRRCRHLTRAEAPSVIAGYLVANDVSIRDWQTATPTITMGKSWDTHGPIGPWVTTADEVADPHALDIRTWVNGELRQSSNTRHLMFDCFEQIAHLSTVCTLEPGDVVATGTPSGVGALMQPPQWLVAGDVVTVEVEGLGRLENTVVDEVDDKPWISD